MKRIVIGVLFVLFLCSSLYAYYLNDKSFYIQDKLNGVCWNSLNEEQKVTLLFGLKEGLKACISTKLIYEPAGLKKEVTAKIPREINFFITNKGTVKNVTDYCNKFYSDPANLQIPILEAFVLMVDENKGTIITDAQRNERIKGLRIQYGK